MKKVFLMLAMALGVLTVNAQSENPIVERIDEKEIVRNNTPAAVAYNFIMACLEENKDKIYNLSSNEFKGFVNERYDALIAAFHDPNNEKLRISSWLPLPDGCEISVLYVQPGNYDYPEDAFYKVYINVVPSRELGNTGFQDITRMFNTNVKVLVCLENGEWKADGFK